MFSGCAEKGDQAQTERSKAEPSKDVLSTEDSLKMQEVLDETKDLVDNTQEYHNMIIGSNNIGGVKLGMTKEEVEALGYTIEAGTRTNMDDPTGQGEEESVWVVSDAIGERLKLAYFDNKVTVVYVSSDMVQTKKSAYLEMTIKDFLSSHPNATLHYHFMGNRVWFDVPEMENIEFRISVDDVLEIETIEYDGSKDQIVLETSQANPLGKVIEISFR